MNVLLSSCFLFLWIAGTETIEAPLGVPNPMSSPYSTGTSWLLDWPSLLYLRLVSGQVDDNSSLASKKELEWAQERVVYGKTIKNNMKNNE